MKPELEFAVFCVENLAEKLQKNGTEIYDALAVESDILYRYIIPNYEMLHTQDKQYILNDILDVMREEGVLK